MNPIEFRLSGGRNKAEKRLKSDSNNRSFDQSINESINRLIDRNFLFQSVSLHYSTVYIPVKISEFGFPLGAIFWLADGEGRKGLRSDELESDAITERFLVQCISPGGGFVFPLSPEVSSLFPFP